MGTNIYFVRKVTDEHKASMHTAIDEGTWNILETMIPERLHVGKFSGGWMFLFNPNSRSYHYVKRRGSIERFLLTGTLINEFGDELTNEVFWEMVDEAKDGVWQGTASAVIWDADDLGNAMEEEIIDGMRWAPNDHFC